METIYKIDVQGDTYIGKTCDLLKRQTQHRSNCFNENNSSYLKQLYVKIRELGLTKKDIVCEELETVSRNDGPAREDYFIRLHDAVENGLNNQYGKAEPIICIHNLQRFFCVPCGGSQVCEHSLQKWWCKTCSPVVCWGCDKTYSKAYMKTHFKRCIKSNKA